MSRLILMLLVLDIVSILTYAQSDWQTIANDANNAYEQGDYAVAINLYEQLLVMDIENTAIYYNLGNAYYQQDQLGWALVNYLRAHRLSPRDDDVNAQIGQIRSERIDFLIEDTDAIHLIALATAGFMTLAELQYVVWVMWVVWFAIIIGTLLLKRWRRSLRYGLLALIVPLCIGLVLLLGRSYVDVNRPIGVITETTVEVMSGPGDDYIRLYRLYSAAELRVTDTVDDWVQFRLADGRSGWLPSGVIVLIR